DGGSGKQRRDGTGEGEQSLAIHGSPPSLKGYCVAFEATFGLRAAKPRKPSIFDCAGRLGESDPLELESRPGHGLPHVLERVRLVEEEERLVLRHEDGAQVANRATGAGDSFRRGACKLGDRVSLGASEVELDEELGHCARRYGAPRRSEIPRTFNLGRSRDVPRAGNATGCRASRRRVTGEARRYGRSRTAGSRSPCSGSPPRQARRRALRPVST